MRACCVGFQLMVERQMSWKLRLDQSQQVKLHEILTDSRGQLHAVRQQLSDPHHSPVC